MTHDFAKKPKPATKQKKNNTKAKNQIPGWVWLFIGIVTGLFISFLSYLAGIAPQQAPTDIVEQVKQVQSNAKKTLTTKFDFYTLLPEREVIVPTEHPEAAPSTDEATIYILQAGSFKNNNDADRLRAQLILMGLEAKVEKISNANGDLWHRVQVGPFNDRSRLAKARGALIDNGIDTLLLKRKVKR